MGNKMKVEIEEDNTSYFLRINDMTMGYINKRKIGGKKCLVIDPRMLKEVGLELSVIKEPKKCPKCENNDTIVTDLGFGYDRITCKICGYYYDVKR